MLKLNIYNTLYHFMINTYLTFDNIIEKLAFKVEKHFRREEKELAAGPLVYIIVIIVVVLVVWAVGQAICWKTVGKSFVFAGKLSRSGFEWKLGCN